MLSVHHTKATRVPDIIFAGSEATYEYGSFHMHMYNVDPRKQTYR